MIRSSSKVLGFGWVAAIGLAMAATTASGESAEAGSAPSLEERMASLERQFADERRAYQDTLEAQRDEIRDLERKAAASETSEGGFSLPGVSASGFADSVFIHGFGGTAYGATDGNMFTTANDKGNWDNVEGGFVFGALPHEDLKIQGRIFGDSGGEEESEGVVELRRIFAEYAPVDWFKLRVGRIAHPIGLYSETFDIGTLRPFHELPQGAYGPTGINGESLEGIAITGDVDLRGWGLRYDLYAGEVDLEVETDYLLFDCEDMGGEELCEELEEEEEREIDDLVGGRLTVYTPLDGLLFAVAGYVDVSRGDQAVVGVMVEYLNDFFALRSEYYHYDFKASTELGVDTDTWTAFVETSYRPFRHLDFGGALDNVELVGRYERVKANPSGVMSPTRLTRHTEFAFGVNYWIVPNHLVAKFAYHNIHGNLFAQLDEELTEEGELSDRDTDVFNVGFQFSF